MRIEIDKHETFPGFNSNRKQAVFGALKVLDALKFRHSLQRAVEAVLPSVIRALQDGGVSAGLCDYGSGVVTTHIEESAKNTIRTTNYDNRLTGNAGSDKISRFFDLVRTRDELPGLAEDIKALKLGDARIDIPRGRRC